MYQSMRVRPYIRSNVCIRYEGTPIRQVECMYQSMRVRPYVRSNVCIRYEGTLICQVECMYQIRGYAHTSGRMYV